MKILPLLTFFLSFSVWACPDLAGSFHCLGSDASSSKMTIQQNGLHFVIDDQSGDTPSEFIADGQTRVVVIDMDDDQTLKMNLTVSCKNLSVFLHMTPAAPTPVAIDIHVRATKIDSSNMHIQSRQLIGDQNTHEFELCTRQTW